MIDTHCHIDLYKNPKKILQECEKAGITVLAMTNLPSHFEMGYPHVLPFKKIRLALGMHPLFAEKHSKEFPLFYKNLSKTSYIGEVGLDFSREGFATKEIQIDSFRRILIEVTEKKKILSIHSRRAEKEVFNLLLEYKIKNAIFHWYSGSLNLIKKIADAGYYFSINPAMTISENGKKIIGMIPIDKILTETDGPFVNINNRVLMPGELELVINSISRIYNKTEAETNILIRNNFNNLIMSIK